MKFLLTVFICSAMSGECYTNKEEINNNQLYPKFTCIPKKDEGKIVT